MTATTSPVEERPIRVIVVDDHDLYRTGLVALLADYPEIAVVGQASGGRAGVRLARELRPDVVIMDLRMPDLSGAAATRELLDADPDARVVMLTVSTGDDDVNEAIQAGACGFLVKETPIHNVAAAVRAAADGASWLAPEAAAAVLGRARLAPRPAPDAAEPSEPLSPRELEVLTLVARGLENGEIAASLKISPRTAKNHVSSILAKLGVPNRIQAAVYAVKSGLG